MKIFKVFLVTIVLSVCFFSTVYAQKGQRWKKAIERRKEAKKVEAMAKGVTTRLNVPYLDDANPWHLLDIYIPAKKDKPWPVLVHIHGGGWKFGDKRKMKTTGLYYASKGILFITPNYGLSPDVMHPAHVKDCAAAVAWTFNHVKELGGDKNRIFLSGHSAGAQLAALLATNTKYLGKYKLEPSDLAGVIPVDTASYNLVSNNNEKLVKKLVREAFGSDPKVLKDASPFYNVSTKAKYPDFLILNTTNRKTAVEAAEEFVNKLKSTGCDVTFVKVPDHTHAGMAQGMYNDSDPVSKAILKFILH